MPPGGWESRSNSDMGEQGSMAASRAEGRRTRILALAATIALVAGVFTATAHASAAPPSFQAAGSARQVYVTGAAPNTQMSLLNAAGQVVKTQTVNSLGGLLFRDV